MTLSRVEIKRNELISILSFIMIFFVKGIGFYDGQSVFLAFLVVLLLFLMIKMSGESYSALELCAYVCFGALALYSYTLSKEKGILLCFCMVLLMKNCRLDSVFKVSAFTLGSTVILRGILSVTGVMENKVLLHDKLGGEILRYSFGQPHPNVLHMTYFTFSCMMLYTFREERKRLLLWNRVMFIGSLILFLYSVSYSGVLLSGLLYLCIVYQTRFAGINKFDIALALGLFCGTISFSVLFPQIMNYENDFTRSLILSIFNRFRLLNAYFSSYRVKIWGQNITDYAKVSYQLDNSWASLLLGSGIIIFLFVLTFYLVGIFCLIRNNKKMELYIVVLFVLGGLADPLLFNTSLKNIGLLFLANEIHEKIDCCDKKRITLFPFINRWTSGKIVCKVPHWSEKHNKKVTCKVHLLVCIIAVVLSFAVMKNVEMPQRYAVLSKDPIREGVNLENVVISQEMLKDSALKVYCYQDDKTPMWIVDSERIRRIEYGRLFVGLWIILFATGEILVVLKSNFRDKDKKERQTC